MTRFVTESHADAYCRCRHHAEDHEEHTRRNQHRNGVVWHTTYGQCLKCGCGNYWEKKQ